MTVIAPITYIELVDDPDGTPIPRIAGTRLTVGEIATLHLDGDSPVDWIVDNFEVLNHAQVYAALSYYFDHKAEIDAQMEQAAAFAEQHSDTTLGALIDKARNQT